MKNLMKHPLTLTAVSLVLVAVLANALAAQRLSAYSDQLESDIADVKNTLLHLVTIGAGNGADELTDRVLIDCSSIERERFDILLGSLDKNLDQEALTELDRLFGRCGGYYAERKAFLTARLEQELVFYKQLITQRSELTDSNDLQDDCFSGLNYLPESEQSKLFNELVTAQDKIIQAVISSQSTTDEAVVTASQEAREIQENLLLASTQAGMVRDELIPE